MLSQQIKVNEINNTQIREDSELAKSIKIALIGNPAVDNGNISAEVVDSVVVISGWTSTVSEKLFIEEEASAVPGVSKVINNIEVYRPTPVSDIGITGAILQSLSLHLKLDLSAVFVKVCNGMVFIRGSVPTSHQKMMAEVLARKIPPVIGVINELQIVPTPKANNYLIS
jgi:osmotically-inducible protein OsmY